MGELPKRSGARDEFPTGEIVGREDAQLLKGLLAFSGMHEEPIRKALEEQQQNVHRDITELLKQGRIALLARALAHHQLRISKETEQSDDETIARLAASLKLDAMPAQEARIFLQTLEVYSMLDGISGSDIRRELLLERLYFDDAVDIRREQETGRKLPCKPHLRALPGLLLPSLERCQATMRTFLNVALSGNDHIIASALSAVTQHPLPAAVLETLGNPERLYELMLIEHQCVIKQVVEESIWREAAVCSDLKKLPQIISADPPGFIHAVLQKRRTLIASNHQDITWNQATPVIRALPTFGLPAFDVPILVLKALTPEVRRQLLETVQRLSSSPEANTLQPYLQHLITSLGLFEQAEEQGGYSIAITQEFQTVLAGAIRQQQDATVKPKKKMTEYLPLVFNPSQGHPMGRGFLRTMGVVPQREFYGSKGFAALSFEDLLSWHKVLLQEQEKAKAEHLPDYGPDPQVERLHHERDKLFVHLFLSGIAAKRIIKKEQRSNKITLDLNGLWIRIASANNQEVLAGHLPYALISDALCIKLHEEGWLTGEQIEEVKMQRAMANHDVLLTMHLERERIQRCARQWGCITQDPDVFIARQLQKENLTDAFVNNVVNAGVFPESCAGDFLKEAPLHEALPRAFSLWKLAEQVQATMTDHDVSKEASDPKGQLMIVHGFLKPILKTLEELEQNAQPPFSLRPATSKKNEQRWLVSMTLHGEEASVMLVLEKLPQRLRATLESLSKKEGEIDL